MKVFLISNRSTHKRKVLAIVQTAVLSEQGAVMGTAKFNSHIRHRDCTSLSWGRPTDTELRQDSGAYLHPALSEQVALISLFAPPAAHTAYKFPSRAQYINDCQQPTKTGSLLELLLGAQLVGVAALLLAAVHSAGVQAGIAPTRSQAIHTLSSALDTVGYNSPSKYTTHVSEGLLG